MIVWDIEKDLLNINQIEYIYAEYTENSPKQTVLENTQN